MRPIRSNYADFLDLCGLGVKTPYSVDNGSLGKICVICEICVNFLTGNS